MEKSIDAFRTISEVAEDLELPQHVLRFWETRFPQIKPLKRAGGRRYYRPVDVVLLKTIRQLLYEEGFTIKGVQKLIKEQGMRAMREGNVPMPVDLTRIEDRERDVGVAEEPVADLTVEDTKRDLPASLRAALEVGVQGAITTQLAHRDLAALREAIVTIDECERILTATRRASS